MLAKNAEIHVQGYYEPDEEGSDDEFKAIKDADDDEEVDEEEEEEDAEQVINPPKKQSPK